jgi:hypothetical protein
MTNKYEGAMPDRLFRKLTTTEEAQFRQHARDNWTPEVPENFSVFHPVVRDEWRKIDLEKGIV